MLFLLFLWGGYILGGAGSVLAFVSVVAGFPWVLCPVVGAAGTCGVSGVEDVTRGHVIRGAVPVPGLG